jgi:hypothetical protein
MGHQGDTPLDQADLEALRDITFCRRPDLRLRSVRDVEKFVNRVGFAFLYRTGGSDLPSVWEAIAGRRSPALPRHTHRHPGVGLAWEAKDVLPVRRKIYYGKILRRSPTLVSLELFPAFYALSGNRGDDDDHRRLARAGLLSLIARRIIEVLVASLPLTTHDLKALTGHAGPARRAAFDRGIAELQARMLIVKYAELYEPKFTFLWGPLHRWLPQPIARSQELDRHRARRAILERYLAVRWAAGALEIGALFGWPAPDVVEGLESMVGAGLLRRRTLRGSPRPVYAVAGIDAAIARLRPRTGRRPPRAPRHPRHPARA